MRANQKRLWPCIVISLRVCALGLCTISLLESLAGMWVSLLQVRRRLFSAMELIFEPLSVQLPANTIIRLSKELVSEITSIAILGTLAVVNLRAEFSDFVVATDASSHVMAGVEAPIPPMVTMELSRHCLRKGVWSKLLAPSRALLREHGILPPDEEVPDATFRSHPLWDLVARALPYKESWRRRIRRRQHINVSELESYVIHEKRVCQRTSSKRVPFGLDSQVSLGAVVKGRAASPKLNSVLRRSLAYPIGADVYSLPMYFNTASNRADGPTRDSVPLAPDLPLPEWWNQLCSGDYGAFDAWMKVVGATSPEDEIPFEDVAGSSELDLVPNRVARARASPRKTKGRTVGISSDEGADPQTLDRTPGRSKHLSPSGKPLCPEAIALLESLPKSQFVFHSSFKGFSHPGGLDLFSGRYGVAKHTVAAGCPWVLTYEWNHSAAEDLLKPEVRGVILRLLELDAFLTMMAAPICCSFSVAVTPPVRSKRFPRGLPGLRLTMRQKVRDGNSHSDFLADLITLCERKCVGYAVENPDTSWLWRQRRWRRFRSSRSGRIFRCCFCRFGTPWRKGTRIATNTRLGGVRMMCRCTRSHQQLRGMHPSKKVPWTLVAQPYPRGLCRLLGLALAQHAGWSVRERLNVAACSKTGSLRVGEASNPGPRPKYAGPRKGSLFDTELLTAQTLALQAKQLCLFQEWCGDSVPVDEQYVLFSAVPLFLAKALVAYADSLFRSGGALSNLRHLILACQRWVPGSRAFMQQPWEMVERWEALAPVKHRTPVPESLVQSLCVLAWQHRWYSWVGATVLAFYGAGRLGEVLRCSREDLVLPEDVLEAQGSAVFLRLRSFKSRMRQPAKIQHMKVSDGVACRLLSKIFKNLEFDQPLFGSTAYQYRKRWDYLLVKLGIPKDMGITPGGLRGGAAVFHYKHGKQIQDLLWLLRLRSQTTLECYLQEVAALNTFAKLSRSSRDFVLSTASCFAFLVAGDCR